MAAVWMLIGQHHYQMVVNKPCTNVGLALLHINSTMSCQLIIIPPATPLGDLADLCNCSFCSFTSVKALTATPKTEDVGLNTMSALRQVAAATRRQWRQACLSCAVCNTGALLAATASAEEVLAPPRLDTVRLLFALHASLCTCTCHMHAAPAWGMHAACWVGGVTDD